MIIYARSTLLLPVHLGNVHPTVLKKPMQYDFLPLQMASTHLPLGRSAGSHFWLHTETHTHCTMISLPSDTLNLIHPWRVLYPRMSLSHLSSPVGNTGPSMDQEQHKFCFQVGCSGSQHPSSFKAHTSLLHMSACVVKGLLRDALVLQHTWCDVLHASE